jgi:homoserine kinase
VDRPDSRRAPGGAAASVRLRVPASSANLGPGFDAVGLALTLYNTVLVEPAERWEIDGERDLGRLATHPAYRGARRALAFVEARDGGRRPRALRVRQDNDIPLGRGGLGNSATAVVAAAAAAARLAGRSLDEADLITLAAEIEGHPDNAAAAVLGGLVVAVHAEGRVVARRLPLPRPPRVVLAIPSIEIPTSRARSRLPADLPFADAAFSVGRASLLVAALATGDHTLLAVAMEDRIHTPYRAPLVPGLHEALAAARDAGAWGAALSGSGPAVVALVEPDQPAREAAVASALAAAFARSGLQCAVRGVDVAAEGMTEVP